LAFTTPVDFNLIEYRGKPPIATSPRFVAILSLHFDVSEIALEYWAGELDGVAAAGIFTPLSQMFLLPDLMQVNFNPLYSAVEPVGEHLAPDFGFAALADKLGNKVVAAKRAIEPANAAD
jgi:hypothetical protein